MNINENEEMIEDITDVEENIGATNETVTTDNGNNDAVVQQESVATDSSAVADNTDQNLNVNQAASAEVVPEVIYKKKSKAPALIILFTLLILDIAAIAIYIIGIDKVLSFIK